MDGTRERWYRACFEIWFLKCRWKQFQEFFADIMERAHPNDFVRMAEAGAKGDRGCDGYLSSTATIFQVYAPNEIQPAKLHVKIKEDFEKARNARLEFKRWIFVHNRRQGLHADSVALIQGLMAGSGIACEFWGFEELWAEMQKVPAQYRDEILPPYQSSLEPPAVAAGGLGASRPDFNQASSANPLTLSVPQHRVLLEQIESMSAQLRSALDSEGQALWDEVKSHLGTLSFDLAILAGQRLEQWVNDKSRSASPQLRGRTLILLADLAVIETIDGASPQEAHIAKARKYMDLAREAFGRSISEEDASRLVSLSAKLHAVEGDYDRALRDTEGVDSPGVLSLRLALLIEMQRFEAARELFRDRPLHERWADSAIIVFVASEDVDRAREVLDWARSKEEAVYHRCLFHFAKSLVISVQKSLADDGHGVPGRLPEAMRDRLREALATLRPLVCRAESTDSVRDGVVAESLAIAATAAHRLGDFDARRRYTLLLGKAQPVSLSFARAVQAGFVEAPSDVPDRLRTDHPGSREAATLAAAIEGIRLGRVADAVAAMRALVETARTRDEKEALCEQLLELSGLARADEGEDVDHFIEAQLGSEHLLVKFRRAARLISARDAAGAEPAVNEIRDEQNPLWWQLQAKLEYLKGNKVAAAEALAFACRLLPRPELLRSAIGLAEEADRDDLLEELLTVLTAFEPSDERALFRLASLFAEHDRFGEAAQLFRRLRDSRPEEPTYALNLATCLRNDGRPDDAMRTLDQLCAASTPDLRAVLSRAQLLRETGKADRAFQSLQPFRESFWDNHEYLLAYVGFGFAAGQDATAHQAFTRLIELQKEGKVPADKLWAASVDEVAQHFKQFHERQRKLDELVLRGQVPWLAVEHARGNPPVVAWRFRTREANVGDTVLSRAIFAVYSTNRFTVRPSTRKQAWLDDIGCPPRGSHVIVDLTAILTLSRLGLLDRAREYFGRMYVPSRYIPALAEEGVRVIPHQPSRIRSIEAIRDAVDRKVIRATCFLGDRTPRAVLDEYGNEDSEQATRYHLIDLFQWLHDTGRLSSTDFDCARTVAHEARTPEPSFASVVTSGLAIRLDALRTIADVGLLELVTRTVDVCLGAHCVEQLNAELLFVREQQRLVTQHQELLEQVSDEGCFGRLPAPSHASDARRGRQDASFVSFWACESALEGNLPFFVDDRVCQALVLSHRKEDKHAAFGADAFLAALFDSGLCSPDDVAGHLLQLMRWRYRFLLPPAGILVRLAMAHAAQPPGAPLAEVARYIHDCLRDPGLFGGLEPTEPPMPLAARYGNAWVRVIAEFVMQLWLDDSLTMETAGAFTTWALQEALPGPSSNLNPFVRLRLAEFVPQVLLGAALSAALGARDESRANRGLCAIAEGLGLSQEEYTRMVGEIVNVDWTGRS